MVARRSPLAAGGGAGRTSAGRRTAIPTQNRQQAMTRARKATGNVGTAQQKIRSALGRGPVTTSGTAARAFNQRTPAQKTGLTAAGRASLKQSPAERQKRMASAQGRMGTLVSNFAKRQPQGRIASAQGRMGTLVSNFAKRQRGGTGAGGISALSRPLNRKPTRGGSRGSSRSGGR